jgi:multiple sugar transport system permease protein
MKAGRLLLLVLVAALACVMLVPFVWLVRSSLCDEQAVIQPVERLSDFVPPSLHPGNYTAVFRAIPFLRYFANTVIVTVSVVVATVLSSSLCAYAFAFCKVPYRKIMFYGVMATMMLPGVVTLIPKFILFREIGWFDTFKPLIVPAFFGNAFAIFLFRQFFLGLPADLIDAAQIDGADTLQTYGSIVMPLSKPVCITVAIFSFMSQWNDFMGPLIFLNSQELWTLQLGLNSFMGETAGEWNLLMAATVMVLVPVLLVFFFLQRYFIRGAAMTGLKG